MSRINDRAKLISDHTSLTSTDLRITGYGTCQVDFDYRLSYDKDHLLELLKEELGEEEYVEMLEEELRRYKIETSPLYKVLNDGNR